MSISKNAYFHICKSLKSRRYMTQNNIYEKTQLSRTTQLLLSLRSLCIYGETFTVLVSLLWLLMLVYMGACVVWVVGVFSGAHVLAKLHIYIYIYRYRERDREREREGDRNLYMYMCLRIYIYITHIAITNYWDYQTFWLIFRSAPPAPPCPARPAPPRLPRPPGELISIS